ncbi:unnamed protein product [Linum trigynum]|uniref:Retrovirus-related Pol polyprotein from transposon TNT 1-94-like beta-barrel domain-containing protein n=1 Tax=Linum trigynum TaxID=586398 RepID=A0AAV2FMX6_9ROSI
MESHEAMKLLDFLVGLDDHYSAVRTHLLSQKPPPTLGEAYHAVANDEQQRSLTHEHRPRQEAAAFQGKGERPSLDHHSSENRTPEGRPICTHCRKPGHFRETCYDIIGWSPKSGERNYKPRRRNPPRQGRGDPHDAAVESADLIPGLSPDLVAQLKAFLNVDLKHSDGEPTSSQPKANMSGISRDTIPSDTWVIDSGCNKHIAKDASLFDGELKSNSSLQVRIPNGTGIPVRGTGKSILGNGLVLRNVLHVPDFQCDLLSVSRLTADHQVAVVFLNNFFVIQDLQSKGMIGMGKQVDDLYHLRMFEDRHPVAYAAQEALKDSRLWHF